MYHYYKQKNYETEEEVYKKVFFQYQSKSGNCSILSINNALGEQVVTEERMDRFIATRVDQKFPTMDPEERLAMKIDRFHYTRGEEGYPFHVIQDYLKTLGIYTKMVTEVHPTGRYVVGVEVAGRKLPPDGYPHHGVAIVNGDVLDSNDYAVYHKTFPSQLKPTSAFRILKKSENDQTNFDVDMFTPHYSAKFEKDDPEVILIEEKDEEGNPVLNEEGKAKNKMKPVTFHDFYISKSVFEENAPFQFSKFLRRTELTGRPAFGWYDVNERILGPPPSHHPLIKKAKFSNPELLDERIVDWKKYVEDVKNKKLPMVGTIDYNDDYYGESGETFPYYYTESWRNEPQIITNPEGKMINLRDEYGNERGEEKIVENKR